MSAYKLCFCVCVCLYKILEDLFIFCKSISGPLVIEMEGCPLLYNKNVLLSFFLSTKKKSHFVPPVTSSYR